MDTNNQQSLSDLAVWSEASVSLREFAIKYPVPNLARVTKGQYKHIGVALNASSDLYIHSITVQYKLLADLVKVKDGKTRAVTLSEQKYALPLTYLGWFEVLSADGRSVPPLQRVLELKNTHNFIIREPFKAYGARNNGDDIAFDVHRILAKGEELSVINDIVIPVPTSHGNTRNKHFLRCVDSRGDTAFLDLDQKGVFSAVAGPMNIAGVHKLRSLVEKFRLPIMVRLVHGPLPDSIDRSASSGGVVFRLHALYSDEFAFVSALRLNTVMTPISTREPLKLIAATNFDELRSMPDCQFHIARCAQMTSNYLNSIHILYSLPDPLSVPHVVDTHTDKQRVLDEETDILQDEIDDIYHYVRRGGEPPPPRTRTPSNNPQKAPQVPTVILTDTRLKDTIHVINTTQHSSEIKVVNTDKLNQPTTSTCRDVDMSEKRQPKPNYLSMENTHENKEPWREPIYESLEKFNSKQDNVNNPREIDVPSPKFLRNDKSISEASNTNSVHVATIQNFATTTNALAPQAHDAMFVASGTPICYTAPSDQVKNLREIMKMTQSGSTHDDDVQPPPLPPKLNTLPPQEAEKEVSKESNTTKRTWRVSGPDKSLNSSEYNLNYAQNSTPLVRSQPTQTPTKGVKERHNVLKNRSETGLPEKLANHTHNRTKTHQNALSDQVKAVSLPAVSDYSDNNKNSIKTKQEVTEIVPPSIVRSRINDFELKKVGTNT